MEKPTDYTEIVHAVSSPRDINIFILYSSEYKTDEDHGLQKLDGAPCAVLRDEDLIEIHNEYNRFLKNCKILKDCDSVESWLSLPSLNTAQADCTSVGSEKPDSSKNYGAGSSCRCWIEMPSSIETYLSSEIKACCTSGVNVSYLRIGSVSEFTPLFQM